MHNYYLEYVFSADIILAVASVFFIVIILLYAFFGNYSEKRYKRKLWGIKKNIYGLALKGAKVDTKTHPHFIDIATPQEFLDVKMNRARDAVFFNANEQKIFQEYFTTSDKIKKIEHDALKSRNKWRKIEAILCLGYAQIESALGILEKTLLSIDEDISYFSIVALSQIKTMRSAIILIDFFKKNKFARYKIASILEEFPSQIVSELIKLIETDDPALRYWGLRLVSKLGIGQHLEKIESLIHDPSEEVRAAAAECLGKSGNKNEAKYIKPSLCDDSWMVRASGVKALSELLGSDALSMVMPLINDASLSVVNTLRDVIASHIESASPYLKTIFEKEDQLAKRISIEAIETSGYMAHLLENLIGDKDEKKNEAGFIIKGIIRSGMITGLASSIIVFKKEFHKKILDELYSIDKTFASDVEISLKNEAHKI